MSSNLFFKKKKIKLNSILNSNYTKKNFIIEDVKPLNTAKKNDLSFFDSVKYRIQAEKTKAGACITTQKLEKFLPKNTERLIVKNVLYELANALRKIYPKADIDYPDFTLKKPSSKKYKSVKFGNNVLVGKNAKIGKNTLLGTNSVIEKNVVIGKNCIIGCDVIIKNSIIGENVVVQDGCKIGVKGFGFVPLKDKNFRFPHIGRVLLNNNVELGANCTIDRGSIGDTVIGENTFLDNQVHMAHNVKIGKNCMIAGQVGFAGSTTVGNNVSIGGQAGISGHLNIGNNVRIGGGSGVVKDVPDNSIIMGYPAVPLKEFLKKEKK